MCVPGLELIAQVVFLVERGQSHTQTHKLTDATDYLTDAPDTVTSTREKGAAVYDCCFD